MEVNISQTTIVYGFQCPNSGNTKNISIAKIQKYNFLVKSNIFNHRIILWKIKISAYNCDFGLSNVFSI